MSVPAPEAALAGVRSRVTLWIGDARQVVPSLLDKFDSAMTSPPYFRKRRYSDQAGELGWGDPETYLDALGDVFAAVRDRLQPWSTLWLNLGHSHLDGSLLAVPARAVERLRAAGWRLRAENIWVKDSPQPESASGWRWEGDRLTRGAWRATTSHEPVYQLVLDGERYYSDGEDLQEQADGVLDFLRRRRLQNKGDHSGTRRDLGRSRADYARRTRNARSVLHLRHDPYQGKHAAVYPVELVRRCLLASTSRGGYCVGCGAPWARVTERRQTSCTLEDVSGTWPTRQTLGWARTCACGHAPARRPGHVLDPFGGSGSTAVEAVRLGLDCTLVDLDPAVAGEVERRLQESRCPPRPPEPRTVVERVGLARRPLTRRRYAVGYGDGHLLDAGQLPAALPERLVLVAGDVLPELPGKVLTRRVYLESVGASPELLGVYESEPAWTPPAPPVFEVRNLPLP